MHIIIATPHKLNLIFIDACKSVSEARLHILWHILIGVRAGLKQRMNHIQGNWSGCAVEAIIIIMFIMMLWCIICQRIATQ